MLTLYVRTGCPFCTRVLVAAKDLGIEFEQRNISDEHHATDLIRRGGKRQVPYLVDDEHGIEMYESEDIVAHLRDQHAS